MAGNKSGPVIVVGDPDASQLIQRQSQATEHPGQVLDDELETLINWIAAGPPKE